MKAPKSTTNSKAGVSKAPNFDEVVSFMKDQGIRAIRKRKFRLLGEDLIPDTVLGKSFDLSAPPVTKPYFWVPIGFDGYGWKVYLCLPPWMKKASIASKWYLTWRDFFELGRTDELLEDPEYFIHSTLDDLKAAKANSMSKPNRYACNDFAAYRAAFNESHDLLRRALVEAATIDSSSVSFESQRQEDDRNLRLPDEIARVMELSFRAGQLCERGAWYGRKVPTIARKAMPLVEAQKTNSGPRRAWTEKAEQLMREDPQIKPMAMAQRLKELEIVFTVDDWETIDFEDGTKKKSREAFCRAISRIRQRLKKL